MANLRSALAAGLLNGIDKGLTGANDALVENRRKTDDKTNLEKEYNFIEGLPDSDAQDRALKILSQGQLLMNPKGKIEKYNPKKGGRGGKPGKNPLGLWM